MVLKFPTFVILNICRRVSVPNSVSAISSFLPRFRHFVSLFRFLIASNTQGPQKRLNHAGGFCSFMYTTTNKFRTRTCRRSCRTCTNRPNDPDSPLYGGIDVLYMFNCRQIHKQFGTKHTTGYYNYWGAIPTTTPWTIDVYGATNITTPTTLFCGNYVDILFSSAWDCKIPRLNCDAKNTLSHSVIYRAQPNTKSDSSRTQPSLWH